MKTIFKQAFNKQLKSSDDKKLALAILRSIYTVKAARNLHQIPNLKKLKGHQFAYRIRTGNYRIGIFIRGETVTFAAIIHRKDFYKKFP